MSKMETLETYGWAVIIILVLIFAFFFVAHKPMSETELVCINECHYGVWYCEKRLCSEDEVWWNYGQRCVSRWSLGLAANVDGTLKEGFENPCVERTWVEAQGAW